MSGIRTPAEFARLIVLSETMGDGYMTELLRPVSRGELTVILPARDTLQPPFYRMAKKCRPIVTLVGDDDYQPAGPDGWMCAAKLRDWAAFAVVHGTGAKREHYAMAAGLAARVGRLLLVETSSAGAQQWAAFLRERTPALPSMALLSFDGAHPVMPSKEQVH